MSWASYLRSAGLPLSVAKEPPKRDNAPAGGVGDAGRGGLLVDRKYSSDPPSDPGTECNKSAANLRKACRHDGVATHRSERTASVPSSPLRRSTSSAPMRSSSWAQTADEQLTVTTPERSATGR